MGKVLDGGQQIKSVYLAGKGKPHRWEHDEEVLSKTLYELEKISRQENDQPILLVISFHGPHYSYQAPDKYWDLYKDEDIPLPKIPEDYLEKEASRKMASKTYVNGSSGA